MKIKATHKLIPAIAMLLVSLVLVSSASFAWFTMSKEVKATGMTLTAVAPNNLLISNKYEDGYSESTTVVTPIGLGKLVPASSVDALKFFTTNKAITVNTGAPDVNTIFTETSTPVSANTDGYYYDFHLFLKTTGSEPVTVNLLKLSTTIADNIDGAEAKIKGAVRIGFLDAGDTQSTTITGTSAGVYDFNNAGYFSGITGPIAAITGTDYYKGAAITNLLKDDASIPSPSDVFTVSANNVIKHIIVRVWVEGQDADCINSKVDLNAFKIGVGFKDKTSK